MSIKRFKECEYHDPTSPECLVAKNQLEVIDEAKKSIEFANICKLVNLVCTLAVTISIVFASVAICSWVANHHDMIWFYLLSE